MFVNINLLIDTFICKAQFQIVHKFHTKRYSCLLLLTPCSLVHIYKLFTGINCLKQKLVSFFQIGIYLPDYTGSYPRNLTLCHHNEYLKPLNDTGKKCLGCDTPALTYAVVARLCVCVCVGARACRVTSSDTWYTISWDSWEKTWMIERSYITMQEGKKDMSYRIQFPDRWWRMTRHDGTHETNMMYTEGLFECRRTSCV